MSRNKQVLLVEDEDQWRAFAEKALEGLPIDLTIATDYRDSVVALRKAEYDLIILDNTLHSLRNVSVELIQMASRFQQGAPKIFVHSHDLTFMTEREVKALGGEFLRKQHNSAAFREYVLARL